MQGPPGQECPLKTLDFMPQTRQIRLRRIRHKLEGTDLPSEIYSDHNECIWPVVPRCTWGVFPPLVLVPHPDAM